MASMACKLLQLEFSHVFAIYNTLWSEEEEALGMGSTVCEISLEDK